MVLSSVASELSRCPLFRTSLCAAAFLAGVLLVHLPAAAQRGDAAPATSGRVFANSDLERYLRAVQVAGRSSLHPWGIRAFSVREEGRLLPQDTAHPWAGHHALRASPAGEGWRLIWIRPRGEVLYNSAFPWGENDGAVWAGRGATLAGSGGFAGRRGPLSFTVAPLVFWAQNAEFQVAETGATGPLEFADPQFPESIDQPQRFGDGPYGVFDPGQTTLRVDFPLFAAGVSTANQQWGPGNEFPLILGVNAPGFPHAFLGTSAPANVWLGHLHGRLVWGRLDQSPYSAEPAGSRRFMSGVVAAFTPRGLPGFELGGTRFFHTPWPDQGLGVAEFAKPVEGFFKVGLRNTGVGEDGRSDLDNQLASVFARWVFPASGFELFGEFAREDHSYDLRDFILEPDHNSGYLLGFQKVWEGPGGALRVLRGEAVNSQVSHLVQVRDQTPFYRHTFTRQGHTHRGQILGSPAVYGGAGASLAVDSYHRGGLWSIGWKRVLRGERSPEPPGEGGSERNGLAVVHELGAESVFFRSRYDLRVGMAGVYEANRYFESDAFNFNLSVGIEVKP